MTLHTSLSKMCTGQRWTEPYSSLQRNSITWKSSEVYVLPFRYLPVREAGSSLSSHHFEGKCHSYFCVPSLCKISKELPALTTPVFSSIHHTQCSQYLLNISFNEPTLHLWLHPFTCTSPSQTHFNHPDSHPQSHLFIRWVRPDMHTHIQSPWLATSSAQVTDVCMWGDDSNEYWITGMVYIFHSASYCLPLVSSSPLHRFQSQLHPFSSRWQSLPPSGTPVSGSRKDFSVISLSSFLVDVTRKITDW